MDVFGDFFSPSQETEGRTTTTNSASFSNNQQGNTQNNLWPYLQSYFPTYASTAFNPGQFNGYQTGAADRQAGATNLLSPGFAALSGITSTGLSPTAYQPYMSEYTKNVVDPTVAEFERLNKSAASDINGSLARSGALGNSNNNMTRAAALAPVLNQQKGQIAALYDRGFNQATNTALQSQQQQMGAAGGLGGLLGQYTGANTAGFNIGQQLYGNDLDWITKGASGLTPFLQGAGTNSTSSSNGSSTGTSVGNTSGTTTQNPSMFQNIAGIAGIGAALLSDERTKENIAAVGETFDGQPIYRFNYKGSPTTQIGLMAQDVEKTSPSAVGSVHGLKTVDYDKATAPSAIKGRFNSGGSVPAIPSFHGTDLSTKVAHAFQTLHGLRERAKGGAVPAYDGGGAVLGSWAPTTVSTFDPSSTAGNDVVDQAQSNQFGMDAAKAGDAFMKYADTSDHSKDMTAALSNASSALGNQSAQLSGFMSKYAPQPAVQGFALGGTPDDNDPGTVDPIELGVMPRFTPSADMTFAGVANDPGTRSPSPIVPFIPRPTGAYGSPYASAAASAPVATSPRAPAPTAPSSTWDSIIAGLKSSPLVSGEWTTGTGPAARALLAASGQHIGAPIAQQATTMVQEAMERRKQDEAERRAKELQAQWQKQFGLAEARQTADLTGRLPTGEATFDARKWQQSQAETKRQHDAQIQRMDPAWTTSQSFAAREAIADKLGLKPGSRERNEYLAEGKYPDRPVADAQFEMRTQEAIKLGLDPNKEPGRTYVLTGKMPREDQQPLTATDKQHIFQAEDAALNAENALSIVAKMKEINPLVYSFPGAAPAAFAMSQVGEEGALATRKFNQMSTELAVTRLKEIFGGNPTEGERKILLDIQALGGQPIEMRNEVLDRAEKLIQRRIEMNKARASELRGGTFYLPRDGAGNPIPKGTAAPATSPAESQTGEVTETRELNGKTYVKINGKWFEK